jgi:hypothetical protein
VRPTTCSASMPRKRYNLNLPEELYERAKAQAGDVPMSRFVERALEATLDGLGSDQPSTVLPVDRVAPSPAVRPAPPRASEPDLSEKIKELDAQGSASEWVLGKREVVGRSCERCGKAITSPSLTRHPLCGGKILPEPG